MDNITHIQFKHRKFKSQGLLKKLAQHPISQKSSILVNKKLPRNVIYTLLTFSLCIEQGYSDCLYVSTHSMTSQQFVQAVCSCN